MKTVLRCYSHSLRHCRGLYVFGARNGLFQARWIAMSSDRDSCLTEPYDWLSLPLAALESCHCPWYESGHVRVICAATTLWEIYKARSE